MSSDNSLAAPVPVHIERPATGGAVGRMPDGRVVFVRHTLPGEFVNVRVTETTASFSRGDAVEVLEASSERVKAPCNFAYPGGCGGCDLQHASKTAQYDWKKALVTEHLKRIAGIDYDVTITAPEGSGEGSRTRLRCSVNEDGQLCLHLSRSQDRKSVV